MKNVGLSKRFAIYCTVILLVCVFFENCLAASGLRKVEYQFDWKNPSLFAGYFVALNKGFYKEEGLDVSFRDGSSALTNMKLIGVKKTMMAAGQGSALLKAKLEGIPVVSVAVLQQSRGDVILSLKESNIQKPDDLIGKKVGVVTGLVFEDVYKSMLLKNGIDGSKIKRVSIDDGGLLLAAKKIDACISATYGAWPAALRSAGKEINMVETKNFGVDWYGSCIVVHKDLMRDDPELIRKFIKATLRGWNYCFNNREETIKILYFYNPENDLDYYKRTLDQSLALLVNADTGKYGIGIQTKERWGEIQKDLFDVGYITKQLEAEDIFTNEFLPKNERYLH